jgi:hypothetical protein
MLCHLSEVRRERMKRERRRMQVGRVREVRLVRRE